MRGSDYPCISFYPFNHEDAFERTHFHPPSIISISLLHNCGRVSGWMPALHAKPHSEAVKMKWISSLAERGGCVLRDTPWQQSDSHTRSYGKFILSTSTDLYVLAAISPRINKNPGPTFDTKPYFVIMQSSGGSDRINISCHSLQPLSLPSIPSPPLSTAAASHLPAFLLFHLQPFGIGVNKIFISGKWISLSQRQEPGCSGSWRE